MGKFFDKSIARVAITVLGSVQSGKSALIKKFLQGQSQRVVNQCNFSLREGNINSAVMTTFLSFPGIEKLLLLTWDGSEPAKEVIREVVAWREKECLTEIPIALVRTKVDCNEITYTDELAFAREINADMFYRCSALIEEGVVDIFKNIACQVCNRAVFKELINNLDSIGRSLQKYGSEKSEHLQAALKQVKSFFVNDELYLSNERELVAKVLNWKIPGKLSLREILADKDNSDDLFSLESLVYGHGDKLFTQIIADMKNLNCRSKE